jgi:hypothetical protein
VRASYQVIYGILGLAGVNIIREPYSDKNKQDVETSPLYNAPHNDPAKHRALTDTNIVCRYGKDNGYDVRVPVRMLDIKEHMLINMFFLNTIF